MEIDAYKADRDKVFKSEDASTIIEEAPNPVATASIDELLYQKLINLPAPKACVISARVRSSRMCQMSLFGKMDNRGLIETPEHKNDCYTHECEHCGMLIKLPWKVKGSYEKIRRRSNIPCCTCWQTLGKPLQ